MFLFFLLLRILEQSNGNSLVVQWLALRASTAGHMGSIPRRGTEIQHAAQRGQKKQKKNKAYFRVRLTEGLLEFYIFRNMT